MTEARFTLLGRLGAFRCALNGLAILWREEPTTRFHALGSVLVAASAWGFGFAAWEWALAIAMMGLIWFAEAINTAVERTADAITLEHHPMIGKAKDVASAAVLLASLTALGVGLVIYAPHVAALVGSGA